MFTIKNMTVCGVMVTLVLVGSVMAEQSTEPPRWDTSLAIGATLNRGNTETLGVNAALTSARDYEKWEYRLGTEANYAESTTTAEDGSENTEKTAQNAMAYANVRRKLGRPFIYSDNSILHDEIGGIDTRVILGLGGGAYLADNDKDKLSVSAGLAYLIEKFESGEDDDGLSLRLEARHDHTISDTAKCWATLEYLPSVDDFSDYLLNGEIGADAALNSSLNLRIVLKDRYDNTPPDALEENDLSLIAALVYKL